MNIQLNGEEVTVNSSNLSDILVDLGFADAVIATAVNGDFIPKTMRADTVISNGDKLEVLAPMQGG